jgi:ectonucleotide pyrophosphatase/phosphodiesterase family member 5
LYDQLSKASKVNGNFKVYTEETLPERWKFRNKDRTGPLTVVAELGYAFQDMWAAARYYEKTLNITSKF